MSQANLTPPWAIFYSCTMTAEKAGKENSVTLLVFLQFKYFICKDTYRNKPLNLSIKLQSVPLIVLRLIVLNVHL